MDHNERGGSLPRNELARPILTIDPRLAERITISPEVADGRPCIRDLGIPVADVVSDLVLGDSTEDVLVRYPGLNDADLEAARAYAEVPISLDTIIARTLAKETGSPEESDVLELYLGLPRVVLSYHEHPNMGVPMKVRSSFEAAFSDAMAAVEAGVVWLSAIGLLCFLDEVGTAVRRVDRPDLDGTRPSSVEQALARFTELDEAERAALYALRCALAHDYSLVNMADRQSAARTALLRHAFSLTNDPDDESLIVLPDTPWDGNLNQVVETKVNMASLVAVARRCRDRVLELHRAGLVALALSPVETRRRYVFTHGASIEEFDARRRADEQAKWHPLDREGA